ncbi:hypothetical protein [Tenacibaculum sp. Ill]|uniref:hypothetical protein n=1 Tax=Tenacibaculum sp. Ill TaxID=3445935 RepID=UPI003F7ABDC7
MKKSTQKIENAKDFEKELQVIDKLTSFNKHKAHLVDNESIPAVLSRELGGFKLEVKERIEEEIDEGSIDLPFKVDNVFYETKTTGSVSNSTNIRVGESVDFQTKFELKEFYSKEFCKESTYKAFYEVDVNEIKTFHREFETVSYQIEEEKYSYNCLRIKLQGKTYDVIQFKDETKGYYIFECLEEQSYDEFSKSCFSIQQAIGFISSFMVGGEKFVFDDRGNVYYSNYIRPSIKGMYIPIVTNPYKKDFDKAVADEWYQKLTRISLKTLSNLTHKIHNEPEFSIAILVILEVTSLKSLLVIPSSFAVIIEQLSKHLGVEETGTERPIKDDELKNKILKELHKVIDDKATNLTDESILKIKRRLNEFNKPVNKKRLTNSEKLTRPFEQLGIKLTLHDINIIEHRNDLLHGNILLKTQEEKDENTIDIYMMYVSAKLFTLISKLLLKSVGYDGYVYNQAKHLEKYLKMTTEEEYFEKI